MSVVSSSQNSSTRSDLGTIGEYRLIERIGAGGMAEVFKARRSGPEGFQKTVVVKTILPAYVENRSFVDMLISEATVSAALHHSNIVQVYDLGEVEGRPFIAMEYVEGIDLLQLLKECARQKKHVPLEVVLHICSEVAKGLDYAHHAKNDEGQNLNVIHRDVSPSNVLISKDGEVKITDFGVARFSVERGPMTRARVLKGKMGYMSPEQVKGGLFDGRADLFSLGVVLFEAITLKRLFLGESELETLINIRDVKVEDRLKRHHALVEPVLPILGKALHKSPEERYQRGLDFSRSIQDFLFQRGVRVDATDVAAFVDQVMESVLADPEKAERFRRERLTDDELREEETIPKGDVQDALPVEVTDVLGRESLRPVITQVEIPKDLQEARQTGTHEMVDVEPSVAEIPTPDFLEERDVASREQVPRILVYTVHHRETGVLHLLNDQEGLEVFLTGGVVRTLRRKDGTHPLRSYLRNEELVSEQTWVGIEREHKEGGLRLVDAVIHAGRMQPAEVIRHLQTAYERAFLSAFTWQSGTVYFEKGARIQEKNRVPVELDAAELLTEGIAQALGEQGLLDWLDERKDLFPVFGHEQGLRHLSHREKTLESVLREKSSSVSHKLVGRSRSDKVRMARLLFVSDAAGLVSWQKEAP